ncbi:MAG: ABC transporter permease subunit [Ardenticatenaceae bacterium]|nr:ABC transporter permease subunit [Ardenticatenaceae bacterium]
MGTFVVVYGIGAGLNWLYQFDNPANWTLWPALVLAGLATAGSLFVTPKRPFAIGAAIYTIARGIFNILRSIEPLIMAIVFVVWVGLGPFAGVMALTLHTIAALGKLFSEQIEGISEGPIEAILSTGASRLQMVVFGVIPQIIPPYIAYTLYRWDINVRMSTIIGFVGGGGIGFLLSQSIRLLRYREASVMMLAIAIVVSALDYVSARVRTRII